MLHSGVRRIMDMQYFYSEILKKKRSDHWNTVHIPHYFRWPEFCGGDILTISIQVWNTVYSISETLPWALFPVSYKALVPKMNDDLLTHFYQFTSLLFPNYSKRKKKKLVWKCRRRNSRDSCLVFFLGCLANSKAFLEEGDSIHFLSVTITKASTTFITSTVHFPGVFTLVNRRN